MLLRSTKTAYVDQLYSPEEWQATSGWPHLVIFATFQHGNSGNVLG